MRMLSRLASLWRTLFHKEALDRDLDEELRAAVETLIDRYVEKGMSPQAAQRAALAALGGPGGILQVKERVRDGRIGAGLDALVHDTRYAWRGLWKTPTLTLVIIITLALGIGANVAIFSVVHAMLLEPLPYRHADRLVFVWLNQAELGYPRGPISGPDLQDLRAGSTTIAAFGGIWATGTVALSGGDNDPEQLRAAYVTHNFFQVLGAESALGRTFRPEDSAPGAPPTILIGWELFERRYGADPSIVGREIVVDDVRTRVIGVMPRSFRLLLPPDSSVPDRLQVWQPFWHDFHDGPRGNLFLRVIGRMRPDATIAAARADVDAIAHRITRETAVARAFTTVPLQMDDVRDVRGPLLALFVGVGILLTIACVNVANLLVARAAARARETALRLALGASRGRLLRHALVEGLLLTLLGAAAGVFAGFVGLQVLVALAPESLGRMGAARIDLTVFAFTLAISIAWGLLFSLAPLAELLKAGPDTLQPHTSSRSPATPVRYRTRASLVIVQIALSVVLLIGAGLLVRAFVAVQRIDPGFRSDRQLTFRAALPGHRYRSPEALVTATRELERRLAAIPGVTAAGAISHLPYDDLPNWYLRFALEGPSRAEAQSGAGVASAASAHRGAANADTRAITTGLFDTLGVQLLEGRFFREDESEKQPVVIVDDMLARQLWPGRSAINQTLLIGQAFPERRVTVVGVIRHLRQRSLVEDLTPQIFIPYRLWQRTPMAYVVRTDRLVSESSGDNWTWRDASDSALAALTKEVRAAVAAIDPRLPIYDVRPMTAYVESARSIRRFTMLLAAAFALSALLLTCVGVYGVLAYAVAVRRHEFGVRRALGADSGQVLREVMREGLGFALAGSVGGLAGAAVAGALLQSQLYGVHARDPITYGVSLSIILGGAALACWIPARRALSIDPMDALRTE